MLSTKTALDACGFPSVVAAFSVKQNCLPDNGDSCKQDVEQHVGWG